MKERLILADGDWIVPVRLTTSKATNEKPHVYSEGIDFVLVNGGVVVLKDEQHTDKKPGAIIYGKGSLPSLASGQ